MLRVEILNLKRLPARLTVPETAALLGFADHDLPVLMAARLLKPLGNPAANAPKYFAAAEVERLAGDTKWLGAATTAISKYWRRKREARTGPCDVAQGSSIQ
jgi:hypothetical protein